MALQTATNPTTGERVVQVDGAWQPITQSATNPEGAKAYLVGGKWLTDTAAPAPAAVTATPAPAAVKEKPYWQRALEPVLETVLGAGGAIIGGGAGTLAAPGPGTIAGGVAGGGLGYAAAKEIEKNIENYMDQRKPQGLAQESLDAAKNTLVGAAFESGGRVLLPPVAKAQKSSTGEFRVMRAEGVAAPTEAAGPIDAEPSKPYWQRALNTGLEVALPTAGAIIGGGAGTLAAPGPGTIAGGVAGGGLGYAAAK